MNDPTPDPTHVLAAILAGIQDSATRAAEILNSNLQPANATLYDGDTVSRARDLIAAVDSCPTCGAGSGKACTNPATGEEITSAHQSRFTPKMVSLLEQRDQAICLLAELVSKAPPPSGPRWDEYVIVADDGYPSLAHCVLPDDEDGCHVMHVDAGDTLAHLIAAAAKHEGTHHQ